MKAKFINFNRKQAWRFSCLMIVIVLSHGSLAAQSIVFDRLLNFQKTETPTTINTFLTSGGQWRSEDFDNDGEYSWVNAAAGETVEQGSKAKVSYNTPSDMQRPVVIYATPSQEDFSNLLASAQQVMTLDKMLKDTESIKMYCFSNSDQIVIAIKPLQVQEGQGFRYVFMIYAKADYKQ